jgi:hypothetical protein
MYYSVKEAMIFDKSRLAFIPGVWIVYGSVSDVGLIHRWPLYQDKNISPPNESHSLEAGLYNWRLDGIDPSLMWVLFSAGHYTKRRK